MTQQGLRQASARALSGFAAATNYNEDLMRLFDSDGIPAGTFNERQLRRINATMTASYTNLSEAMQAYAETQRAYNWAAMGALEITNNFTLAMPAGSTYTRASPAYALETGATLTACAVDVPQRTGRGLALEPERTNLAFRSQAFDNAAWSQNGITRTANSIAAPDGTTTADTLGNSATATDFYYNYQSQPLTSGDTCTDSVFGKVKTGAGWVWLLGPTSAKFAWFNLTSGVVGARTGGADAFTASSILALASDWEWAQATFTLAGATGNKALGLGLTTGNSANACTPSGIAALEVYAWGFQREIGEYATSPILTAGASATRALPVFTEVVPAGFTKALLIYADETTTLVTGLTPGGVFDYVAPVIAANKGRFGASELVFRVWQE